MVVGHWVVVQDRSYRVNLIELSIDVKLLKNYPAEHRVVLHLLQPRANEVRLAI